MARSRPRGAGAGMSDTRRRSGAPLRAKCGHLCDRVRRERTSLALGSDTAHVRRAHNVEGLKVALEATLRARLLLAGEARARRRDTLQVAFLGRLADELLRICHRDLGRDALLERILGLRRRRRGLAAAKELHRGARNAADLRATWGNLSTNHVRAPGDPYVSRSQQRRCRASHGGSWPRGASVCARTVSTASSACSTTSSASRKAAAS